MQIVGALSLVTLLLAAGSASADIAPPNSVRVKHEYVLVGAASLGDHKLYMVSKAGVPGYLTVTPDVVDGALTIPPTYMGWARLFALSPAQVAELDAVRGGKWEDEQQMRADPTPFMAFFERADLARSEELEDGAYAAADSGAPAVRHITVGVKVEGGRASFTHTDGAHASPPVTQEEGPRSATATGGGCHGGALALGSGLVALVGLLTLRRRAR